MVQLYSMTGEIGDTDEARLKLLFNVPGYTLAKPLEVLMFERNTSGLDPGMKFVAVHLVPSARLDVSLDNRCGNAMDGYGPTEDKAVEALIGILTGFASDCKTMQQEEIGSNEVKLLCGYLNSVLIPQDGGSCAPDML